VVKRGQLRFRAASAGGAPIFDERVDLPDLAPAELAQVRIRLWTEADREIWIDNLALRSETEPAARR
jgi:hypothetical protein